MDYDKKKSGVAKKSAPVGAIVVSLVIGAVIGSAVTYSLSKPQPAPVQSTSSPAPGQMPQNFSFPSQQQFTPATQPPGDAPPGKVWSAEHGHWHDLPGGTTIPAPAPATPPPAGTNK